MHDYSKYFQTMASLSETIKFNCRFLWVTSTWQVIILLSSCFIYILTYNQLYKLVLSLNAFFINMITAISILNKDEYLKKSGFYRLYNVTFTNLMLSKSIVLHAIFMVHLSLLLLCTIKVQLSQYLICSLMILSIFIIRISVSCSKQEHNFLSILIPVIIFLAISEDHQLSFFITTNHFIFFSTLF
jgi:hypothetical protein